MFDVGNIEQLNIEQRWKNSDATMSLKTPIGIDYTGRKIYLDVHEKYHGPHGLIAGSTGSGKSEFIITYVLSLAINYHPDDVSFVLIRDLFVCQEKFHHILYFDIQDKF